MNKGARVRRIGFSEMRDKTCGECREAVTLCDIKRAQGFTTNRIYRIKAGRGDATVGSDNSLRGAFILNETQMVLTDDYGINRQVSFDTRFWELVEDCESMNPIRVPVDVYKPVLTA